MALRPFFHRAELLQRNEVAAAARSLFLAADGVGQFRDIDRACRIDRDAVRRNEWARLFGPAVIAESCHQLAGTVEDAHARSEARPVAIAEFLSRRKLGDIEAVL